jgi:hypothetical protein
MPSATMNNFENYMLKDVKKLLESHAQLNHKGLGRRGLGHITRSGVIMLCAAWEIYVEGLLEESVGYLSRRVQNPNELPMPVQKEISKSVKESKHDLKPLELAGRGWELVYNNHAIQTIQGLNTPKSTLIDPLFHRLSGIPELSSHWSLGKKVIDDFVSARGEIAHKGGHTNYITIAKLRLYLDQVYQCVLDSDNAMSDFISDNSDGGRVWRRRTH